MTAHYCQGRKLSNPLQLAYFKYHLTAIKSVRRFRTEI
jgi:hypothetical protein